MGYGSFEATGLMLSGVISNVYDKGFVLIIESNDSIMDGGKFSTVILKRKRIVVLLVFIFFMACLVFAVTFRIGDKKTPETDGDDSVMLDIPDVEVTEGGLSKSEAYKTGYGRSEHAYEAYFDSLALPVSEEPVAEESEIVFDEKHSLPTKSDIVQETGTKSVAADLLEIESVSSAQVDSEVGSCSDYSAYRPMSRQERIEHDKAMVEMAVQMVSETQSSQTDTATETSAVSDLKSVEFKTSGSDCIITSLDDIEDHGRIHYRDSGAYPVKCMFLRDEKVKNGQRIIFRLMEDLEVDGILLPANTRLSAVCTIGERLFMEIASVEYGGRIIRLGYSAYDTDGTIGIYCPETGAVSAGKQIKDDAVNTVSSAISGFFGQIGNAFVRTGANLLQSGDGVTSVNVAAGYEFYIYKESE